MKKEAGKKPEVLGEKSIKINLKSRVEEGKKITHLLIPDPEDFKQYALIPWSDAL